MIHVSQNADLYLISDARSQLEMREAAYISDILRLLLQAGQLFWSHNRHGGQVVL